MLALMVAGVVNAAAWAGDLVDPPFLAERVKEGALPPVSERLPAEPSEAVLDRPGSKLGHYGGDLRMVMGRAKDIRMMIVYGYARLVGYDRNMKIVPDILKSFEVEDGRIFTFQLRKGHRWSDGHPFTAEDFRYFWENMALDPDISPLGPSKTLPVEGKAPKFEVIDDTTVRYTWHKPNPFFLPAMAAASPLYIYRPAHYLKNYHATFVEKDELQKRVEKARKRNWRALHYSKDRQYRNDNVALPTLQPWLNTTPPPSDRFIFERNPYYHRVDSAGRQLPYIDRAVITIADPKLIPAKVGSGEVDLQARSLQFKNYTFLKRGEKRNDYSVFRWLSAKGAQMALYPNLNVSDPVWRKLTRNVDFRRALSLAIDRHEINQVIFFGLAIETSNTVLPMSSLFDAKYRKWAKYDIERANALLDGLGLTERGDQGIRLLPDGRPAEIIVETAGEDSEQADVLELIRDSWRRVGIKVFTKPTRREVLRRRAKSGATMMSVWFGLENGVPAPDSSPAELAPTSDDQLHWPQWGLYHQTSGKGGKPIDLPEAQNLFDLNKKWVEAVDDGTRRKIWQEMLAIHADQVFSIGLVAGVVQPVVVSNRLRNVPEKGIYNWDPGAHFGVYRPDTFWFDKP